jgi:predicted RNase H-like nuclease (RuvC/YqgF family)
MEGKNVHDVMCDNNICGSDAKTTEELVEQLKCDNLELKRDVGKLTAENLKLEAEVNRLRKLSAQRNLDLCDRAFDNQASRNVIRDIATRLELVETNIKIIHGAIDRLI